LMLAMIVLAWRMHNSAVISKILCFAVGSSLLAAAAKNIVAATRPLLWPSIEHAHGSSFPSSHAMASLGLAFITGWVLHEQKYAVIRWLVFATAISCGMARVYIGVHRPSDILLSWLIVISWHYWVTRCFNEHEAGNKAFSVPNANT
jgi:membrane-associated phospholipid phosphatase